MNDKYADPLYDVEANNQVHHIWYYIQLGYYKGRVFAALGNIFHETWPGQGGRSREDYNSGVWCYTAGYLVKTREWSLFDLSSYLRNDIGK